MPLPIETPAPKASSLIKKFQQNIDSSDTDAPLLPKQRFSLGPDDVNYRRKSWAVGSGGAPLPITQVRWSPKNSTSSTSSASSSSSPQALNGSRSSNFRSDGSHPPPVPRINESHLIPNLNNQPQQSSHNQDSMGNLLKNSDHQSPHSTVPNKAEILTVDTGDSTDESSRPETIVTSTSEIISPKVSNQIIPETNPGSQTQPSRDHHKKQLLSQPSTSNLPSSPVKSEPSNPAVTTTADTTPIPELPPIQVQDYSDTQMMIVINPVTNNDKRPKALVTPDAMTPRRRTTSGLYAPTAASLAKIKCLEPKQASKTGPLLSGRSPPNLSTASRSEPHRPVRVNPESIISGSKSSPTASTHSRPVSRSAVSRPATSSELTRSTTFPTTKSNTLPLSSSSSLSSSSPSIRSRASPSRKSTTENFRASSSLGTNRTMIRVRSDSINSTATALPAVRKSTLNFPPLSPPSGRKTSRNAGTSTNPARMASRRVLSTTEHLGFPSSNSSRLNSSPTTGPSKPTRAIHRARVASAATPVSTGMRKALDDSSGINKSIVNQDNKSKVTRPMSPNNTSSTTQTKTGNIGRTKEAGTAAVSQRRIIKSNAEIKSSTKLSVKSIPIKKSSAEDSKDGQGSEELLYCKDLPASLESHLRQNLYSTITIDEQISTNRKDTIDGDDDDEQNVGGEANGTTRIDGEKSIIDQSSSSSKEKRVNEERSLDGNEEMVKDETTERLEMDEKEIIELNEKKNSLKNSLSNDDDCKTIRGMKNDKNTEIEVEGCLETKKLDKKFGNGNNSKKSSKRRSAIAIW